MAHNLLARLKNIRSIYLLYRVAMYNCKESKGKDLESTQSSVWGRYLKRSGRQLAVNPGVKYLNIKK